MIEPKPWLPQEAPHVFSIIHEVAPSGVFFPSKYLYNMIAIVLECFTRSLIISCRVCQEICVGWNLTKNRSICHNFFFNSIDLTCKAVIYYFEYVLSLPTFIFCKGFSCTFGCLFCSFWFYVAAFRHKTFTFAPSKSSINSTSFATSAWLVTIDHFLGRKFYNLLTTHTNTIFNRTKRRMHIAWSTSAIN